MTVQQLVEGQEVWYLYRIPGSGGTGRLKATVLKVNYYTTRVTVKYENGHRAVVLATNLHPTS